MAVAAAAACGNSIHARFVQPYRPLRRKSPSLLFQYAPVACASHHDLVLRTHRTPYLIPLTASVSKSWKTGSEGNDEAEPWKQQSEKVTGSCSNQMQSSAPGVVRFFKWALKSVYSRPQPAEGKMQKSLHELLVEHDLPTALFPQDAADYEFDGATGKLTVIVAAPTCHGEFEDSSESAPLRFSTAVTGRLEKGKLADVEGIKTKVMRWTNVTSISAVDAKVHFGTGSDAEEAEAWTC